ncbi:MAG TPA: MYXO-CTERM sorting domain-containing protein [Kofleriaceae bacterium]|nr:MYXO-CTERM sorting domain-containing protein [Kofleriaceae bacterium]
MRRISPAFALTALLLPSTALAQLQHHRMTPAEVLLSSGGDDAIQFVELSDPGEPFPDDAYVLAVYDVDGVLIDSVSFAVDAATTRFFVATAAADAEFGTTRDATLPVTLPAEGQVCFESETGTKFACMAWGCINNVLTGSTAGLSGRGAAPPDGQSLQRQGDGAYHVASPTPDASNAPGDAAPACPTDPDAGPSVIDAGNTGGGADAGPDSPDGGGGGGDGADGGDDDDSGCGCGVNGPGGAASSLGLAVAALLVAFRRRRRA